MKTIPLCKFTDDMRDYWQGSIKLLCEGNIVAACDQYTGKVIGEIINIAPSLDFANREWVKPFESYYSLVGVTMRLRDKDFAFCADVLNYLCTKVSDNLTIICLELSVSRSNEISLAIATGFEIVEENGSQVTLVYKYSSFIKKFEEWQKALKIFKYNSVLDKYVDIIQEDLTTMFPKLSFGKDNRLHITVTTLSSPIVSLNIIFKVLGYDSFLLGSKSMNYSEVKEYLTKKMNAINELSN